ncbi:MAG: hypothetical protein AAGH92_13020, partial [Planctomycetota bacterium]
MSETDEPVYIQIPQEYVDGGPKILGVGELANALTRIASYLDGADRSSNVDDGLPPENRSRFCEMISQIWTHSGKVKLWLGSDTRRSKSSGSFGRSRCT